MNDFARDRHCGSTDVARAFLDDLRRWTERDRSTSIPALRAALLAHLRTGQAAQPAMGLVHQLAARALDVADSSARREDGSPALREHLANSCAVEREDLERLGPAVAAWAVKTLEGSGGWIATLSSSGAGPAVPGA